jgi:hypothetical protein
MPQSEARRIGLRTHLHDAAVACGRMPAGRRSGTAGRPLPHDLGHAAVSLRLNSAVPVTAVARRAGHGIAVLLKIPADFGCAGIAEQEQVFMNALAQGGEFNWAPYDGC